MDDYGRPQGDQSPDDDDGPRYFVTNDYDDNDLMCSRYNVGLISEWHELGTDHAAMLTLARYIIMMITLMTVITTLVSL